MALRRGSLADIPYIVAILFVVVLGVWISFYIIGQLQANPIIAASTEASAALGVVQAQVSLIDEAIILFTILASVAAFILAFRIKTHPAYYIASLISTIFLTLFYSAASNALIQAGSSSPLLTVIVSFPYSLWLITHLPKIATVMSLIVAAAGMIRPASVSATV